MFETVREFHEYMNQLYDVAVQHGLRQIIVNTGPNPMKSQQILLTWKTPKGESPNGAALVGKSGEDQIYIVKW